MCAVVEGVQGRGTWRGFGGGLQLHAPELGISLDGEDAMRGADWLSAPIRGEPFGEASWGACEKCPFITATLPLLPPLAACSSRFIALRTTSPILLLRPVLRAPIAATGNRARAYPDSHRCEEKQLACPPTTSIPASSKTARPTPEFRVLSTTLLQSTCLPPRSSARLRSTLSVLPRSGSSGSDPFLVRCCGFSGRRRLARVSNDTNAGQLRSTTPPTLTLPRRLARSPRASPHPTPRSARTATTPSSSGRSARPSSRPAAVSAVWPDPTSAPWRPPRATTLTATTSRPASTAHPSPPPRLRPLRRAGLRPLPRCMH